jgi:cyclase
MQNTLIPFDSQHFKVFKLADGVFAAIAVNGGAAISNAGIIDLGERTLIFDTFMTPQAAGDLRLAAQQLTGREPDLIINSHYHNDHIWGNQVFSPQSLIISTVQTLELMRTEGREELKWAQEVSATRLEAATREYEAAQSEHQKQDALLWVGYFRSLVDNLPGLTVRFPDITFEQGLTIHGSARSVELMAFPDSHTSNDSILILKDLGIIFMADLLFVNCHPFLDECDVTKLRDSLNRIAQMGATVFVPGHGPLGSAHDLATNLDYISMCQDVARDLISQGDTSPERIARQAPSGQFADWELSRFFTFNLQSLCKKLATEPSAS